MNTQIEVHQLGPGREDEYKVVFKDAADKQQQKTMGFHLLDSLLSMRQKESMLMGKFRFKLSESDFTDYILGDKKKSWLS